MKIEAPGQMETPTNTNYNDEPLHRPVAGFTSTISSSSKTPITDSYSRG